MFGTVARSRLREGVTIEQVKQQFDLDGDPTGAVSLLVFQSTTDPRELWIASAFESQEAYVKSSESPEQQARFERMTTLLEGQPEWHDGEVVVARGAGVAASSV